MQSLISISVFEIKNILVIGGNSIIIFLSIIIKQCPSNNILDYLCSIFFFWQLVLVLCSMGPNGLLTGCDGLMQDFW